MESLKSSLEETIPLLESTANWCKSHLIQINNQLNHDSNLKVISFNETC